MRDEDGGQTPLRGGDPTVTTPRILVIGAAGFVGRHLVQALEAEHGAAAVVGAGRDHPDTPIDILDGEALRRLIAEVCPSHVVNLAGIAAPEAAARDETAAWALHLHAATGLGRAILELQPQAQLLHVGSGLAYGRTARHGRPVSETEALEPMDAYGVSKSAGDLAIGALASTGLRAVRLRPFNHTGPGQSENFAVPAFAKQIARIEAGQQHAIIDVGNLESSRDFLDVRDVAAAYAATIRHGDALTPGIVLNVASGHPIAMRDILNRLLAMSMVVVEVRPDPARQRPSDLRTIAGDASALRLATGWVPSFKLDDTLRDVLDIERARAGLTGS